MEQLFEHNEDKTLPLFDDDDYEEHNKRHNRVKSYSFSIGRPR